MKDYRLRLFPNALGEITLIKVKGNKLFTEEYGELIDMESGCWASPLGHNVQRVNDQISYELGIASHTHQAFTTDHPSALCKEIISYSKIDASYSGTFLSSGTEAVQLAVSLAEVISKRKKRLSFNISYHGAMGELRMPRDDKTWTDLDVSRCIDCKESYCCDQCENLLGIAMENYSSFVFEPGNSGGIVLFPSDKLIDHLVRKAKENGTLVIVNEVTTGFGRTGKWFGFQHYEIFEKEPFKPDFICMGKGLGNGYPISGILISDSIATRILESDYRYVQSHIDDPLGCVIGRKVCELLNEPNLIDESNRLGEDFRHLLRGVSNVTEVRGRGMMNVCLLNKTRLASDVVKSLLTKGVFCGFNDTHNLLRFYAPLITSKEDIQHVVSMLKEVLSD